MTATFHVGDAIEVMSKLPEKSVDLVLTSPPFLALRSYLPQDHPDKALEGGSQATPGEYVDWLLDVVEACARVLAPHGSLCFELGDTYSGSGGAGGDYAADGLRDGQPVFRGSGWHRLGQRALQEDQPPNYRKVGTSTDTGSPKGGTGWPLAKSLSLIPESFRWAMVYGHNPFTGRQTEPWRLRNVIRWVRPNPPVGALGDKFRPATSELMVFCKAKDRYFDLDAVREPYSERFERGIANGERRGAMIGAPNEVAMANFPKGMSTEHSGAPPLDWWNIPLLEGEEPTPYGPGEKSNTHRRNAKGVDQRDNTVPSAQRDGGNWSTLPISDEAHPLGSPPLDWWNIPLLGEPCPTCEGEGYLENGGGVTADYSHCPTCFGNGWVRQPTPYGPQRKSRAGEVGTTSKAGGHGVGRSQADADRWAAGLAVKTEHPLGSPPLDWWNIPPGGYPGAHYAVWPPELLIKPIKAMCPEKVCRVCGEASRRIVEREPYFTSNGERTTGGGRPDAVAGLGAIGFGNSVASRVTNEEWSDCGCTCEEPGCDDGIWNVPGSKHHLKPCTYCAKVPGPRWRPGTVLDPFAGTGTTLSVATGHGRDAIGIDLDERNYDLALDRVGPLVLEQGAL